MNNKTPEQVIWLCRHGNRIDFVDRSWRGKHPYLSEDGLKQAAETGKRLCGENIKYIFTSPFLRAIETAHIIANHLELQVKIEYGASEWLNPNWFPEPPEYIPPADLLKRFPRIVPDYKSKVIPEFPENAETALERAAKTSKILADLYPGDNILIVGHGQSIRGMLRGIFREECDMSPGLCSLTKIVRNGNTNVLELKSDCSHLKDGNQYSSKFN